MAELQVIAGTIDYQDSGGDRPALVFLHGVVMNGAVWDPLVNELRCDYRCIVPTLPLGAHRRPMRTDADLSLGGLERLVGELLERLDLQGVTLVQNDHVAALALVVGDPERVGRLVISSGELFQNYPPGLVGKNLRVMAMAPGGIFLGMRLLRVRGVRRLPNAYGWLSKRPLPDDLVDGWLEPPNASLVEIADSSAIAGCLIGEARGWSRR